MPDRLTRLDPPLAVIFAGYRLVAAAWFTALLVIAMNKEDPRAGIVWPTFVLVWLFAIVTLVVARRAPQVLLEWRWLVADLAIGAWVLLAPLIDGTVEPLNYAGGYPIASVMLWSYVRGRTGALVSAGVMIAIVNLVHAPEHTADTRLTVSLIYAIGAATVAWGGSVLQRADARRREMERSLASERAERLRLDERAEMAARVHDSVLQTLTLIQRRADDAAEVRALARTEERSLRRWLFADEDFSPAESFSAAIRHAAAEVESAFGVRVDVVTSGDAAMDAGAAALVAATREAITNGAKHSAADVISVYAEVVDGQARAYVRDRGRGFDAHGDTDGHGIIESIVGRLERHGGTAAIRSEVGAGTEVELGVSLDG